ncbi:MAG TPA: hypothetical protein PLV92_27130, partial [Pirellulaceae bacterium]|nr:hypothetical protein [Pirellulaceae bacterium]
CAFVCDGSFATDDDREGTGGGLAAACATIDLDRAWFLHNEADTVGGGVRYGNHDNKHALTLTNAVFQGNASGGSGMALWYRGTGITSWPSRLEHVVFADHHGDTPMVFSGSGLVLLSTTLIAHNDASILLDNRSPNFNLLYLASWDNTGDLTFRSGDAPATVLEGDPRALAWTDDGDADDDVWTLRPGSPLLDAGFADRRDPDGTRESVGLGGPSADASIGFIGMRLILTGIPRKSLERRTAS